jgi:hypothetical protein
MATGSGPEGARSGGPEDVLAVLTVVERSLTSLSPSSPVRGSRAEWAEVVRSSQRIVDAATAVQHAAIAQLAAIEPEELEDGTEVESHRAPGHISLDAPAVLAGALNVSAVHAQRRVDLAVWLAADGPVGTDTHTGLGGLHEAMRSGLLDGYRAMVVAEELDGAPAEVRATVVSAIAPHFAVEDAVRLRRRCRRTLARISPDLLRQRAQRARSASGLRRWAEEPGVDRWEGTFPSEEAATAWAAIDALAQDYVSRGECATIERARAKALTDLVTGHSTVRTVVTLTVPADAGPWDGVQHRTAAEEERAASERRAADEERRAADRDGSGESVAVPDAESRTLAPDAPLPGTHPEGPGSPAVLLAGSHPDDRGSPAAREVATHPEGPGSPAVLLAGSHPDDLLEVGGLRPGDAALVARSWVDRALAECGPEVPSAPCHPATGALLDATGGSPGYRPGANLAALVRQRDGRCRFPGCAVAARFCDLDHVRPWPTGPTSDENLVCLCRRHHRVKQRPGWSVRLGDDGMLTWTSPTGDVRRSEPVDALRTLVLAATLSSRDSDAAEPGRGRLSQASPQSRPRMVVPDGPHTVLEFALEHQAADVLRGPWPAPGAAGRGRRGGHDTTRPPAPSGRGHDTTRPRAPSGAEFSVDVDCRASWPHRRLRAGRQHGRHGTGPPPF